MRTQFAPKNKSDDVGRTQFWHNQIQFEMWYLKSKQKKKTRNE